MATSSLRVVFVLPTYLPESFGGAEQQTRRMMKALSRLGHQVTLLAPRLSKELPALEQDGDVTIRRFRVRQPPNFGGRHFDAFLVWSVKVFAWLLFHRHRYDLVHVIHGRLHAVPAVWAGALLGKPTIVKVGRGGYEFDLSVVARKRLLGTQFARMIVRSTRAYVANSTEIVEDLRALGVPDGRIFSVPNGVDIPDLAKKTRAPAGAPRRFVFLGRLDVEKAVDRMIRAFAMLPAQAAAHLHIVGDGPLRAELEELARTQGAGDRITFTGAVDDVTPWLLGADFFLSTSRSEGMSNSLLESMSYGLVPIVTRVSGVADIVEDGRSGLLVPVDDVNAIVAALGSAVAMPAARLEELSGNAAETIRARYSIDAVAERHDTIYRSLLAAHSPLDVHHHDDHHDNLSSLGDGKTH